MDGTAIFIEGSKKWRMHCGHTELSNSRHANVLIMMPTKNAQKISMDDQNLF